MAAHAVLVMDEREDLWTFPPGTLALLVADARGEASLAGVASLAEAWIVKAVGEEGEGSDGSVPWPAGTRGFLRAAAQVGGSKRLALVQTETGVGLVLEAQSEQADAAIGPFRAMVEPGSERQDADGLTRAALAGGGVIAWTAGKAGVRIGLGEGALGVQRAAVGERARHEREWRAHLAAGGGGNSGPGVMLYIDANALRRAIPDAAAKGWLERLLRAWDVENARALALHACDAGGGPSLVATWSARSDEPGRVRRAAAELGERDGAVVVRGLPLRALVSAVVEAQGATLSRWGAVEHAARWSTWQRKHGEDLGRLVDLLTGEAVVRAGERGGSIMFPLHGDPAGSGGPAALLRAMMRDARGLKASGEDAWEAELAGVAGLPHRVRIRLDRALVVEWE